MSFSLRTFVFGLAAFAQSSVAGYHLVDDYSPANFFDKFAFFTDPDPTNGFVQYVDQGTAQSSGLISSGGDAITMAVDSSNMAPSGRSSVRITSKKVYNHGLIILDLQHMPIACGAWPAFWTVGPSWPEHGEIDIIEGVNMQAHNAMTLHTGPDCSIANDLSFLGNITTPNCDVNAWGQPDNAGCSIGASDPQTYGAGLNEIQGGVYATEWTGLGISIYFFPRSKIPADITAGKPNPRKWGMPLANFQGACNMDSAFNSQQIVFDTTFCGDWAGASWASDSTCAAKSYSCEDYVANNPEAFKDAYWKINSLKVYQSKGGSSGNAPKPPVTHTNAGPTGIVPTLPPAVSSLAPIPVTTQPDYQTTYAAPSPAWSQSTGYAPWPQSAGASSWNTWAAPSATPNPWGVGAAAVPSATTPGYTSWPAPTPVAGDYKSGEPLQASWFADGAGIPSSAIAQPTYSVPATSAYPTPTSYYRERRHIHRHKRLSHHARRSLTGHDHA